MTLSLRFSLVNFNVFSLQKPISVKIAWKSSHRQPWLLANTSAVALTAADTLWCPVIQFIIIAPLSSFLIGAQTMKWHLTLKGPEVNTNPNDLEDWQYNKTHKKVTFSPYLLKKDDSFFIRYVKMSSWWNFFNPLWLSIKKKDIGK